MFHKNYLARDSLCAVLKVRKIQKQIVKPSILQKNSGTTGYLFFGLLSQLSTPGKSLDFIYIRTKLRTLDLCLLISTTFRK